MIIMLMKLAIVENEQWITADQFDESWYVHGLLGSDLKPLIPCSLINNYFFYYFALTFHFSEAEICIQEEDFKSFFTLAKVLLGGNHNKKH